MTNSVKETGRQYYNNLNRMTHAINVQEGADISFRIYIFLDDNDREAVQIENKRAPHVVV